MGGRGERPVPLPAPLSDLPMRFLRRSRLRRLAALLASALVLLLGGGTEAEAQREVRAGNARVVFWPGGEARARETLKVAAAPVRLPGFGPSSLLGQTTVYLAPSRAVFDSLTGGRAPEWAGGVAIPSRRVLVLPAWPGAEAGPEGPAVVLRHELAHLLLSERLPGRIPRWFDEGFAELTSGSWDAANAWQLRVAFLTGAAPRLDSLSLSWPRDGERARFAYLLSATAVDHMVRRTGEDGFALLLRNWREEGSLDAAIRTTWGMTPGGLEEEWREAVRERYGWLAVLSMAGAFWMLVLLVLFAAYFPRRKRNRERLAAMTAEERMLPPPRADGVDVQYPLE